MAQTSTQGTAQGGASVWIFRVLLVAAAAFMVYSWFAPWWSAKIAILPGDDHMVMRPWGVEVVSQVRANVDASLFSMPFPEVFAGFMWVYLVVCMLALAGSLFITKTIRLGRFSLPWAVVLIGLVGLSYLVAVGLAYGIGELKAGWAGAHFIGKSTVTDAMSGNKVKMVSDLRQGYWLALAAGPVLIVLAILRGLVFRSPKA